MVALVYLLIGVIAYWPVIPGISDHLFSVNGDFTQSVWFIAWFPHAISHGINPFFTNAMMVPNGVNLAENTASPFLGLLSAPFALVLSPLVIGNLFMVVAMPISAFSAFAVFRRWQIWDPVAVLGGLIYGFSPYMVGQGVDHPELIFLPVPPLIALTVTSILQHRGSRRRLGVQLGLLVSIQYLISQEVLAIVIVVTVLAVIFVCARHPTWTRQLARTAAVPVGIAVAVTAVLLAYPIWMMTAGPQHFTGPTFPVTNAIHNDLFSFIVPGPLQKVSLGMRSIGIRLVGGSNPTEAGGYIGVPLLIITGYLAWRSRRSPRTQLAVALLFGTAVLTIGTHLAVNGRLIQFPLPFALLDHVPLLNNVLPSRVGFSVAACLAAVVAFGLDDIHRSSARGRPDVSVGHRHRDRKAAVLVGVTLLVLIATQLPMWPYARTTASVLPTKIQQAIPPGDPIAITYPYDTDFLTVPMLWQAEDGFRFRLIGGYAYHPTTGGGKSASPSPMNPPDLENFLSTEEGLDGRSTPPVIDRKLLGTTRATLSRYDIRVVIVDRSLPGSGAVTELLTAILGPPKAVAGNFSVWADWPGSAKA